MHTNDKRKILSRIDCTEDHVFVSFVVNNSHTSLGGEFDNGLRMHSLAHSQELRLVKGRLCNEDLEMPHRCIDSQED